MTRNNVLNNQPIQANLEDIGLIFPDVSPEPIINIPIPIWIIFCVIVIVFWVLLRLSARTN